jgi:prepilin-type N-terminal cleavage/methylation domain-containing protein
MFKKLQDAKGFTLIELLVVIAIIGILAVLIILNLSTARKKARDAQRKSNLSEMQVALENYNDDNSNYPTGNSNSAISGGYFSKTGIMGTYLSKDVKDPQTAKTYTYVSIGSGSGYKMCATPEIESNRNDGVLYCVSMN